MTTLSLAFSFWPCCPERGLLAPDEEYLPQSRIVPCRSKIKLAELLPSSRSCFAPSRSTLATPGAQRPPVILIPVRYPGQGARGGGAGHCPRVLKRYYEPVINRALILPRVLSAVQCGRRGVDCPAAYAAGDRGLCPAASVRTTRVVLATAHRNHDTADNSGANLMAVCQRCHMLHDAPEHRRMRWPILFRRRRMGDLFRGPCARQGFVARGGRSCSRLTPPVGRAHPD